MYGTQNNRNQIFWPQDNLIYQTVKINNNKKTEITHENNIKFIYLV